MPTARNHAAAGVVNNKIYIIGGRLGAAFMLSGASNTDIVEEYDPATDQWGALRAPMPAGGRSAAGWGTFDGRIYVVGGEARSGGMHGTFRRVEAFDAATNTWVTMPQMSFHRHGMAADVLNGRLHVVSGNVQSGGGPAAHLSTDVHEALTLK